MIILDKNGDVVDSPDYEKGYVEQKQMVVEHAYVVDTEEVGHWETIAEYPETGGTDVEWHVDTPEEGHWETRDEEGELVEHYDGTIPEDWPKEQAIPDVWEYGLYTEYTPEELDEREKQKGEAQTAQLRVSQMQTAAALYVKAASFARMDAISVSTLYDEWSGEGVKYYGPDDPDGHPQTWLRYGDDFARVEQTHTSQPDWTPDAAPSLYTLFRLAPDGIRIWEQPTHAENAFDETERCHYPDAGGQVYESKIDGNTTVPGSDDRWWKIVE